MGGAVRYIVFVVNLGFYHKPPLPNSQGPAGAIVPASGISMAGKPSEYRLWSATRWGLISREGLVWGGLGHVSMSGNMSFQRYTLVALVCLIAHDNNLSMPQSDDL